MNEKVLNLIGQGQYAQARKELIDMNVVDIAQLFEEMDRDVLLIIFRILPKEIAAGVFTYIPPELQEFLVESITDKEIISIWDKIFFDDAF